MYKLRIIGICIVFIVHQAIGAVEQTVTYAHRLKKVVIDAGHGGHDGGCKGGHMNEKEIALQVALLLGKKIEQTFNDVEVIYTRKTDVFIPLNKRTKIANDAKADLFISIHINSSPAKVTTASGTETFVLGLHRNDQKEGAIGEYSNNLEREDEGILNPNDPMTQIIIAQYSQAFLSSSIALGTFIEDEFTYQGRRSSGVKQKGLEVLAGCVMPGVLVELGFINNPDEEAYLNSEEGQLEAATALFNGVKKYKSTVENPKN